MNDQINITNYHKFGDLEWKGLYASDAKFKKYVSPESFAHPAKMSFQLCDKILRHLEQIKLLQPGDTILDFMAGTFRTGVIAELHRYPAIGVELEQHFVDMIEKNRQVLKRQTQRDPSWTVIKGDSRKLSELLNQSGLTRLVSPPYSEAKNGGGIFKKGYGDGSDKVGERTYAGSTHNFSEGQIGRLPDKVSLISPPYGMGEGIGHSGDRTYKVLQDKGLQDRRRYGNEEGQIGNLDYKVALTSPPYACRMDGGSTMEGYSHIKPYDSEGKADDYRTRWPTERDSKNIGNLMEGVKHRKVQETYLSAMLEVYKEASKVCKVIACVTKNPTRDGKLRRLDIDTALLLEQAGFRIVDYHRAMLFEEHTQNTLIGTQKKEVSGRLSFFKRVSHQKGNVVAQWEDILIAVKEGGANNVTTITSPPYIDNEGGGKEGESKMFKNWNGKGGSGFLQKTYGKTEGQIARLKDKAIE